MAIRTNYVTNPSFEVDIAGWTVYGGGVLNTDYTAARDATVAKFGSASIKVAALAAAIDDGVIYNYTLPAGNYYVSGYIKTGAAVVNSNFVLRKADFTVLVEQHITTASQDWTRVSGSFSLGTTTSIQILFGLGSYGSVSGGTAWLDGVMIEDRGTLGTYFDGSTVLAGHTFAWTGTSNASTSTDTTPDAIPAAPTYVVAQTASNEAYISWNAPVGVGVTSFKVKRSTTSGSGYTTIATPTVSYYDDTAVTNGTTYYYVVSAVSTAGEGSNSTEAVAPVAAPTPHGAQWYTYGSSPIGISYTTVYTYLRNHWDRFVSYTFTQSGATQAGFGSWRVQTPDQTFYSSNGTATYNATVSEGLAYGMIAACYMSNNKNPAYDIKARSYFHGFLLYYKYYKDAKGLMNWHINNAGIVSDTGGATDADMDAAFACLMMHRLYGSSGAVNYLAEGLSIAQAILNYEFLPATGFGTYNNLINNGDGWDPNLNLIYPDYFSAAYLRIFQYHMTTPRWSDIITANYQLIPTYWYNHYTTGLIPDGSHRDGTQVNSNEPVVPAYKYSYNSIRMAWRMHLDWLWNGNTIIQANHQRLANLIVSKSQGSAANVHTEPLLDWSSDSGYANQAFVSGYGSICCSQSGTAPFAATCINYVHAAINENSYFGLGQSLMNLLLMSGEFQPNFGAIPGNPSPPTTTTTAGFLLNML